MPTFVPPVRRFLVTSIAATAAIAVACAPGGRRPAAPAPAAADTAAADTVPGTDVFLVELTRDGGSIRVVGRPINFTQRAGYDNQPAFTPDGETVLYTSVREDGQADIYRYDIGGGFITQLTRTPESEYSPAVLPTGEGISVVRVEPDSTQRLWQFDLDGANPRLVLENVDSVGYYAWSDAQTLALFVLGEPPTLRMAEMGAGSAEVIAENVGRSIHRIPGGNTVSYVQKLTEDEWWIHELDPTTGDTVALVRTLPGVEDYTWMPDGTLLMAQGSRLHAWRRGDTEWREIHDFSTEGLVEITRIAVGPEGERIALVATDS